MIKEEIDIGRSLMSGYSIKTDSQIEKINKEVELYNNIEKIDLRYEGRNSKLFEEDFLKIKEVAKQFILETICIGEYRLQLYLHSICKHGFIDLYTYDKIYRQLKKEGIVNRLSGSKNKDDITYIIPYYDIEKSISTRAVKIICLTEPLVRKEKIKIILNED